ncbi:MAG TPA: GyrI-like domain-containing protein [Pseudoduganella sp.]
MDISIVELEPVRVAYLRHTGAYGPALNDFWRKVVQPWMAANGLQGRVTYGVALDDPRTTPPDQCRYDACVAVDKQYVAGAPAALETIPGGWHASTRYAGPASGIGQAWDEFYGKVLGEMGLRDRPGACFERYAADFSQDPATGAFECELFIPIDRD